MKLFLATLVFQIEIEGVRRGEQFDEQVYMLHAVDEQEAFSEAKEIGRNLEEAFTNNSNQRVKWSFVGPTRIMNLSNCRNGEMIQSTHHDFDEINGFRMFQSQKALELNLSIQTRKALAVS